MNTPAARAVRLSLRQRRILWLRSQGASGPQIARVEGLAVSTVDYHERVVIHALRAGNITHAVHLGTLAGLIGARLDCGDRAAYLRHLRRRETACPACRIANARHAQAQRAGLLRPQRARESRSVPASRPNIPSGRPSHPEP